MRIAFAFTTCLIAAFAAGAGPAAPVDPVALHAKLVKDGEKVVADLLAAEAAREAYDREGTKSLQTESTVQAKVEALNKDNAAYTKVAADHALEIKLYNEQCGKSAAPAPKKFKTQAELDAAKAAEVARVTGCNDRAMALDTRSKALDEQRAGLETRRAELQSKVSATNESIDQQQARGRELNDKLGAAEEAADEWLTQMNAVLNNKAFLARAHKVEGCKARREMVISGKDLKVFHGYMYLCAGVLKGI
jgi:chromosome segregation ATPase